MASLEICVIRIPSWACRPNPEDRINRKPEDQKMTIGPYQPNITFTYILNGLLGR